MNPLCKIAAWTNVYDVGDFDTASRILIADIFAKKRKVKIEENKGQNNQKSIFHQKINVNGLQIDSNFT